MASKDQNAETQRREDSRDSSPLPLTVPPEFPCLGMLLKDRYRIESELGRGGFGVVFLGRDEQLLGKPVVIKFLLEQRDHETWFKKKFHQEIEALARIDHPGVIGVLDAGELPNGKLCIVMQFVEGKTLRSQIGSGGMCFERVSHIMRQMGHAMAAAHAKGIHHRDLKPDNVMLQVFGDDEEIKIIDFGLAHVRDSQFDTTKETTTAGGTVAYMAPEQLRGKPSAASDIYAMGVIAYELLTGKRPFYPATPFELLDMQRAGVRVKPKVLRPDLPKKTQEVILKALSFEAEDRYQQAQEFGDAFAGSLGQKDERTTPSSEKRHRLPVAPYKSPSQLPTLRQRDSRKVIHSLAILPLTNDSGDSQADYLSDGITETIINNLSQLPQLKVMSRTTMFRFKGGNIEPLAIAKQLNVAAILTGRMLRMGSRLIIQVELVDAADGSQIWGDRYNREVADVLEIQDEIATEVSLKLQLKLTASEKKRIAQRHTISHEAYHAYLKGRFHWNKRSAEGLKKSLEYFNEAIEIDPVYAGAYAGLADSYAVLGNQHLMASNSAYPRAKAAAMKAIEINDCLAEAYTTLGYIKGTYDRDWPGSEKAFRRAIEINPGYATAHQWYSAILRAVGRIDEAINESIEARELDPLSLIINANVGLCLYFARRYDLAIEEYRRLLEIDSRFFWAHYLLGGACRQKGEYKLAISEISQALELSGGEPVMLAELGYTYAVSGDEENARVILHRLENVSHLRHVSSYDIATIYVGLGNKDSAFEWLRKASQDRDEGMLLLRIDPMLDSLRTDERFSRLLESSALN